MAPKSQMEALETMFGAKVPSLTINSVRNIILGSDPKTNFNLIGAIGVGKTTAMKQIAKDLYGPKGIGIYTDEEIEKEQKGFIKFVPAFKDTIDVRGLPDVVDVEDPETKTIKKVAMNIPFIDSGLPDPKIHGEKGILVIDELNLGEPAVLKALQSLLTDRRINSYVLPEGWQIVMTMNPMTLAKHFGTQLPAAFKSRTFPIYVRPPMPGNENEMEEQLNFFQEKGVHPAIVAYLKFKPDALYDFESAERAVKGNLNGFATPRTWHFLSDEIIGVSKDPSRRHNFYDPETGQLTVNRNSAIKEMFRVVVAGALGQEAASTFLTYINCFNEIPEPLDILKEGLDAALKKKKIEFPGKSGDFVGHRYAICMSLISYMRGMYEDKKVMANFCEFIYKFAKELGGRELATKTVLSCIRLCSHSDGQGKQFINEMKDGFGVVAKRLGAPDANDFTTDILKTMAKLNTI